MKRPRAQLNVVHQGATSVAVGQYQTSTREVEMLIARPTIVMRLGATQSGTKVTNLKIITDKPNQSISCLLSHQFQYFCMRGSSRELQEELYWCSFSFFSSLSDNMLLSWKIIADNGSPLGGLEGG